MMTTYSLSGSLPPTEPTLQFPIEGQNRELFERVGVTWTMTQSEGASFAWGKLPPGFTLKMYPSLTRSLNYILLNPQGDPVLRVQGRDVRVLLYFPKRGFERQLQKVGIVWEESAAVLPKGWTVETERETGNLRQILLFDERVSPRFRLLFQRKEKEPPEEMSIFRCNLYAQRSLRASIVELNTRFERIWERYQIASRTWILKGEGSADLVEKTFSSFRRFNEEARPQEQSQTDYHTLFSARMTSELEFFDEVVSDHLRTYRRERSVSNQAALESLCGRAEAIFSGRYRMLHHHLLQDRSHPEKGRH